MPDAKHKVTRQDYRRAKGLRRGMPVAEKILWLKLRELPKELGISFRRQHPIHSYIVDFICLKQKLVIEVDGDSHDTRQQQDYERDAYLLNLGYKTLRFTNGDVLKNSKGVVATILTNIKGINMEVKSTNSPPLEGGVRGGVLSQKIK